MPKRSTLTDDAIWLAETIETDAQEIVDSEFGIPLGMEKAEAEERRKRIGELDQGQQDIVGETFGGRAGFLFGRR